MPDFSPGFKGGLKPALRSRVHTRKVLALFATQAVAGTMTVGPAALSLPELAQALTKAGMATEASPALAERGAFVCLKDRKPEVVRSVLGEALGIAFQPSGAGWLMIVDPEAKERERLFTIQYRRQAVEKAHAWAVQQEALRAGKGYAALDGDVQSASMDVADYSNPTPTLKARLRRWFALADLLKPSGWSALADLRDGSSVGAALGGPVVRTLTPDEAMRDYGLPARAVAFPQRPPSAIRMEDRFDPRTGFLSHVADGLYPGPSGPPTLGELPSYNFRIKLDTIGFDNTASGPLDVRVEGVTLTETFNRMSQAAGDTLRSFDPAPALPTTPVATDSLPASLSSVLQRLGTEAVMELSPRFEELPRREMPPTLSLSDAFAIPAFPAAASRTDVPLWLDALANPEDRSSVTARARAFPWRVRVRGGIFEAIDPVAFLDRAQWISPVPYLRAEKILATIPADAPRDRSGTALPDWSTVEALAGTGLDPRSPRYRGVEPGAFAGLFPIARLVATVPAAEREAFWRQAQTPSGAKASVEGGTLTLSAQRWGAEYGYAKPVVHILAHWTGPKAETVDGNGTIASVP